MRYVGRREGKAGMYAWERREEMDRKVRTGAGKREEWEEAWETRSVLHEEAIKERRAEPGRKRSHQNQPLLLPHSYRSYPSCILITSTLPCLNLPCPAPPCPALPRLALPSHHHTFLGFPLFLPLTCYS